MTAYAYASNVTDADALKVIYTGLDEIYTDGEEAWKIWKDEAADCDEDCLKAGSKWSVTMLLNAIGMAWAILQLTCVAIGAKKAAFRLLGACCANCVCCWFFAVGITTFVFRGNGLGRICAMNKTGTNYPTDKYEDGNDDWTYEKDGALILAISIISFICCCSCCWAGSIGTKPAGPGM